MGYTEEQMNSFDNTTLIQLFLVQWLDKILAECRKQLSKYVALRND